MSSEHEGDWASNGGHVHRMVRLSKNQALFRDVNERVEKLADGSTSDGLISFVCECSHTDCTSQIELTHEEYEHVRSVGNWFFVRPGHEIPDIEDTIESNERFAVVAKIDEGKTVVELSNPRRQAAKRTSLPSG